MRFTTFRKLVRGLVGVIALTCSAPGFSQEGLLLQGRVKVEGGSIDGGRVVVHREGRPDSILTAQLSKFKLRLELNAEYLLSFEKEGFVTKKLFFNTQVPRDARTNGYAPFDFVVSLFKEYNGSNDTDFDKPMGKICYERSSGDFNYDSNYTKNVQMALRRAKGTVVEKPVEEKTLIPTAVHEEIAIPDSLIGPSLQVPDVPRPELERITGDRTSIETDPMPSAIPDLSSRIRTAPRSL